MISYAHHLADYFRNSRQFFFTLMDIKGNYSYANPLLKEKFPDLSTHFVNTATLFDISDRKKFLVAFQNCLDLSGPVSFQTSYSGNEFSSIQWELSPILDEMSGIEFIRLIGTPILDSTTSSFKENERSETVNYQATLLENVSDVIISCSNEHLVKTWNKAAEVFYNIKADDAIGKKITDLVQVKYIDISREEAHKELYEKGIWKGKVIFENNGEKKYLFNTLSFVINEQGERIGIMVLGKDITAQQMAEEQLKQSELFYRNLFADSLDGILLTDQQGTLQFTSHSVKTILGFEEGEVVGKNAFEYVHPEDREIAISSFSKELKDQSELKFLIIRLLAKNGNWVWCKVRAHNLFHNVQVGRMAIYFSDYTIQREAEHALRESEERFRRIITDLKLGVIMRDPQGKAVLCNKAVLDFTGLTEEEFLQTSLQSNEITFCKEDGSELKYEDHPSQIPLRTKKPVRDVVLGAFRKKLNKWAWLLVSAEPILDNDGQLMHVITTFIDITERKKLEEKLIAKEISKQKIITKATLDGQEKERKEIGKELHDNLGQQLTTTQLFLDLAKSNTDDATLELILMASKSISDVINEIRRLSRSLTPPTLGDLGLIESVKDLCDSIKTTQAFAIRFYHKNFDEKILEENAKLMLFRIIQEQVNNIMKHADASTILIRFIRDKHQLRLVIADNGKGFDPAIQKRGLGIHNIINRAEMFNGKIQLDSAPGEGCTLTVIIPFSDVRKRKNKD